MFSYLEPNVYGMFYSFFFLFLSFLFSFHFFIHFYVPCFFSSFISIKYLELCIHRLKPRLGLKIDAKCLLLVGLGASWDEASCYP